MRATVYKNFNWNKDICQCLLLQKCGADSKVSDKDETTKIANNYITEAGIHTNGKYIFSAVQPYQKALADKNEGSLFTRHLIKGLAGGDGDAVDEVGNVTLFHLHKYIHTRFMSMNPKPKQIPTIRKVPVASDDGKDIVFKTYKRFAEIRTQKAGLERIIDVTELQEYYKIDPDRVIPIRCLELKTLKDWIANWRSVDSNKKKPIILRIYGLCAY